MMHNDGPRCAFCKRRKDEVKTLIASGKEGPHGEVRAICGRCVGEANKLIRDSPPEQKVVPLIWVRHPGPYSA